MEVKRFGFGLDRQDKWLAGLRSALAWARKHAAEPLDGILELGRTQLGSCNPLQAAAMLMRDPWLTGRLDDAARKKLDDLIQRAGLDEARHPPSEGDGPARATELETPYPIPPEHLQRKLSVPSQGRLYYLRYAMKMGMSIERIHEASMIDPWFLDQLHQLVAFEYELLAHESLESLPRELLFRAKQLGYSDAQLANLYLGRISSQTILQVRAHRKSLGIEPVYKLVDTCAAEFEAQTPYFYSTYESPFTAVEDDGSTVTIIDDEVRITDRPKLVILGGGPTRIGQGIEFDYCCVQAAFAAGDMDLESVMINSNPETVSTDFDTSDLLFFEPLTLEDVLNIIERLDGGQGRVRGAIVQFGGQTPLNLAHGLREAGVPIVGTSVDSIDLAEDRKRFAKLLNDLGIRQPENGIAMNIDEAIEIAGRIGYPVLVRPSFVLGGRAMETVFDERQLRHYMKIALGASDLEDQPILIDKFLAEAIECDVDVIGDFGCAPADQARALVCGVMEHIEEAGVHSGDSACAIPPYSLPEAVIEQLKAHSRRLAEALKVCGLMNVQYAIKHPPCPPGRRLESADGFEVFVLEVNPRASRTVPFVSKATGVPWARIAARAMAGRSLLEQEITEEVTPEHTSVKESVFPFSKFPGVDVILGPEMRSTGEVMGIDRDFPLAFLKSQLASGTTLPLEGKVFLSVRDSDKPHIVEVARQLVKLGFEVLTTGGTRDYLKEQGVQTTLLKKIAEGRPNCVDLIKNHELALIINTPTRKGIKTDEGKLRSSAVRFNVPMITTTAAAAAAVSAITALKTSGWGVRTLQEYHELGEPTASRHVGGNTI
ncbi:MAG: carbamoyl-phosphate synthase large subunit [Phycisphaeraceae bacterium]|nr:carbamoyl-phosphate synthase large subunit [Phycisphaeraceae bacterium]